MNSDDFKHSTSQDLEFILEVAVSETRNIEEYLKRYESELGADAYQMGSSLHLVSYFFRALTIRQVLVLSSASRFSQ